MNLFYQPLIPEGHFYLDIEESRHCTKVLRKKSGDAIRITDGKGFFYDAIIATADPQQCVFTISSKRAETKRNFSIHVAISPTKNTDRIEWFVEKAVELGIEKISFMRCANTERIAIRKDRMEKIAVTAMKQSLKASIPFITELLTFQEIITLSEDSDKFIAYVDPSNPDHLKSLALSGGQYLVLIGPEGDFTQDELASAIRSGFIKVSLGTSRLRTETAGLAACHVLNMVNS